MKDIHKNPIFYYVLVPVLVALWPLLVWAVYLPGAQEAWDAEQVQYLEAQKIIKQVLERDPRRLDAADSKKAARQFEYAAAIDEAGRLCNIASTKYEFSSKPPRVAKNQKTQSCRVVLKDVGITDFAKFLSTIQHLWPNLKCEKLKLTRIKGSPDAWKAELDFKYYF